MRGSQLTSFCVPGGFPPPASVLVSRNLQPEGADTVVVSGQILEKPQDPRDATEVSPAKSARVLWASKMCLHPMPEAFLSDSSWSQVDSR